MNEVSNYFQAVDLRELNDLLEAAANVVGEIDGYKRRTKENEQKEPWWKLSLESQIKNIR